LYKIRVYDKFKIMLTNLRFFSYTLIMYIILLLMYKYYIKGPEKKIVIDVFLFIYVKCIVL